jgi:polyhydroxyalkanoate synthesis regulator phasin
MDPSQLSTGSSASSASSVQGGHGHHHHQKKSVTDQVSEMSSAIDTAVKAGQLTSDQATAMKKELADVTQTLSGASTTSTSAQAGSTTSQNPLSQLSSADRQKVMKELHDVGKELYQATRPQGAASAQASKNNGQVSSGDETNSLLNISA